MRVNDFYGNKFKWFVGVIRRNEGGMIKVRCIGIHPFEESGITDGPAFVAVSDDDLPYATVVYPVDSTSNEQNLHEGDWVYGFFADGDSCQQPVVIGKIGRAATGIDNSGYFGDLGGEPNADAGDSSGLGTRLSEDDTSNINVPNPDMLYTNIPGGSNRQKIFNLLGTYFIDEEGLSEQRGLQVAAGITHALRKETTDYNPTQLSTAVVNPANDRGRSAAIGGKGGIGICQWTKPRRTGLEQMCRGNTRDSLTCQLNFLLSELKDRGFGHKVEGDQHRARKMLLQGSSATQAAAYWTQYFLRPGGTKIGGRAVSNERFAQTYAKGADAKGADAAYKELQPNFERASRGGATQPTEQETSGTEPRDSIGETSSNGLRPYLENGVQAIGENNLPLFIDQNGNIVDSEGNVY